MADAADQPTPSQRTVRLYRRLRSGDHLTARQIAALIGFRRVDSVHRYMLCLEREDAELTRAAALDPDSDRPVVVWFLQTTRDSRG